MAMSSVKSFVLKAISEGLHHFVQRFLDSLFSLLDKDKEKKAELGPFACVVDLLCVTL